MRIPAHQSRTIRPFRRPGGQQADGDCLGAILVWWQGLTSQFQSESSASQQLEVGATLRSHLRRSAKALQKQSEEEPHHEGDITRSFARKYFGRRDWFRGVFVR
jgi:hypothetical protein